MSAAQHLAQLRALALLARLDIAAGVIITLALLVAVAGH
jgi:hypothetical protein